MKIIGHRGAAGLALENSLASLQAALDNGADAVEIDARLTADGHVVLCHDAHTGRVAVRKVTVRRHTLAALRKIKLNDGQRIPTLDEALGVLGKTPVIIEIKDSNAAEPIVNVVKKHKQANVIFASFSHSELRRLRELLPEAPVYVLDHLKPIEIIGNARRIHATGIGLNKWLMNPLTYHLAKRYGLEMYSYTMHSRLFAKSRRLTAKAPHASHNRVLVWFFRRFYPRVAICTDRPDRLAK